MKKIDVLKLITALLLSAVWIPSNAQVLVDENFDSYAPDDDIIVVGEGWESTFNTDDADWVPPGSLVSDTRFVSPSNALLTTWLSFSRFEHPIITEDEITYSMKIFVEEDSSFSIAFGDTIVSGTQDLTMFFEDDGTFYIINNDVADGIEDVVVEIMGEGTYPPGEWFDFEMIVNMDLYITKVFINDEQVGGNVYYPVVDEVVYFSPSPENPLLDPDDVDDFGGVGGWIDDLKIEVNEASYSGLDIGIVDLAVDLGLEGDEEKVRARVQNGGATEITSFDIVLNYNDGELISTKSFTGLSFASGEDMIVDFDDKVILNSESVVKCSIANVNGLDTDDDEINNEKEITLPTFLVGGANKKIFIEEATGAWCGFCPRVRAEIEWMLDKFPEHIEVATIHELDTMATAVYDASDLGVASFPKVMMDRSISPPILFTFDLAGSGTGLYDHKLFPFPMESIEFFELLIVEDAHAIIRPEYTYDPETRVMDVTVEYEFTHSVENYRVAIAITEDGVSGTGDAWNQANYLSGDPAFKLFGPDGTVYTDLPHPIPAADIQYNHVARTITPSIYGGDVIASAEPGDVVTRNFSITLDEGWEVDNVSALAVLFDNENYADNVEKVRPKDFDLGIVNESTITVEPSVRLYPNPAQELTVLEIQQAEDNITTVQITSIDGKPMQEFQLEAGSELIRSNIDLAQFSSGIYFISIRQGDQLKTLKLVKK